VALFYHSSRQNCIDLFLLDLNIASFVPRIFFVNSRLTSWKIRKNTFLLSLWVIITRGTQTEILTEWKVKCMLLLHIARSLEALYNSWLRPEEILGYNLLVPFWPSDLFLSFCDKSPTLPVSPYLALKLWISSPGGGLTLESVSENVKIPTHNYYLSSTRFATKRLPVFLLNFPFITDFKTQIEFMDQ